MQARLTLWSIIVMALIVGFVSVLDLTDEINRQFQNNLQRADLIRQLAVDLVVASIEPGARSPVRQDLLNDRVSPELPNLVRASHSLVEIAVCDPGGRIMADSRRELIGTRFPAMDDFRMLVNRTNAWNKLRVLLWDHHSYQISQGVVTQEKAPPLLIVRAVVYPGLIRDDMMPSLQTHAGISIASIVGAMLAALLFSTVVFRPLGKLDHMLDQMAKGDFPAAPAEKAKAPSSSDAFGAMTSKVSMLGQALRGKQSQLSDLKDISERLLDQLEDAVLIFGRDRRLIAAAGTVEKFLIRPRGELLGRSLTEIFPPSTSLGLLLAQAMQTGRAIRNRRVPLSSEAAGRGMQVALLSVETMDGGATLGPGAGMLIRLRDPETTSQIGRQLQLADRLSAISRLTGGVAHEVKNPLNAMLMHVELARMKMAHGDFDLEPQMDVISSEILRLDRVVKTFLDFTRPVKLAIVEVPLEAFVDDLAGLAGPQAAAAGIEIVVQHSPEAVSINVDADLLKQAVLNIVVNAIEAMPDGGELRIGSGVKGDFAEIRISDTGPGIPSEVREKIYNLYFTTKKQGSGIGLAMTYRIVQLHDGTIECASERGKGATFTLRFPIAAAAA